MQGEERHKDRTGKKNGLGLMISGLGKDGGILKTVPSGLNCRPEKL